MWFGPENALHPGAKQNREVKRGQGSLPHDNGVNELNRNVLGVGSVRPATEGEQAASSQKPFRHLSASYRQTPGFAGEKIFAELITLQQSLFDETGELASGGHVCISSKFAAGDRPPACR